MNDNDKAKIRAKLISNFNFDLAYKVAVMCDMHWWHSADELRQDALKDIEAVLDNGYDECSSGGLGAYREKILKDRLVVFSLRFVPVESTEVVENR